MENQHRKITGYRDLNEDEVAQMNRLKESAEALRVQLEEIGRLADVDQRCLAIARTEAQTAFMWAVRSIARPETF